MSHLIATEAVAVTYAHVLTTLVAHCVQAVLRLPISHLQHPSYTACNTLNLKKYLNQTKQAKSPKYKCLDPQTSSLLTFD